MVRGVRWTERPLQCPQQELVAHIKAVMTAVDGRSACGTVSCVDLATEPMCRGGENEELWVDAS